MVAAAGARRLIRTAAYNFERRKAAAFFTSSRRSGTFSPATLTPPVVSPKRDTPHSISPAVPGGRSSERRPQDGRRVSDTRAGGAP
jgi:hypothetical protein